MGSRYKTEENKPTFVCWRVCNPVVWYSQNFGEPQSLINNVTFLRPRVYITSGSMTSLAANIQDSQ